jgi:hypothetical protein
MKVPGFSIAPHFHPGYFLRPLGLPKKLKTDQFDASSKFLSKSERRLSDTVDLSRFRWLGLFGRQKVICKNIDSERTIKLLAS